MNEYIGECGHLFCEKEATTKGFVLLRPENEGDTPNYHPAIMCDEHASYPNFFLSDK